MWDLEEYDEAPVEETAEEPAPSPSPLSGPPPVSDQPGLGRPANVPEISPAAAGVGALSSSRRNR